MKDKNFLLLSLKDKKSKKVANAVSNESCRKILDLLTKNEFTESEISKELGVPISTVHYNLEQLQKAGLVEWKNYRYSEKGKEMRYYRLVNKYIIIAPKEDEGILKKLGAIFGIVFLAVLGIVFYQQFLVEDSDGVYMAKSGVVSERIEKRSMDEEAVPEADYSEVPAIESLEEKVFCDAITPCPEGFSCFKFEDEVDPFCFKGDPCLQCPTGKCFTLESYPEKVVCEK